MERRLVLISSYLLLSVCSRNTLLACSTLFLSVCPFLCYVPESVIPATNARPDFSPLVNLLRGGYESCCKHSYGLYRAEGDGDAARSGAYLASFTVPFSGWNVNKKSSK